MGAEFLRSGYGNVTGTEGSTSIIDSIVNLLNLLEAQHRELIGLGQSKREVLISGQTERLAAIVQQESKLVKLVQATESNLLGQVREAFSQFGYDGVTVSDLIVCLHKAEHKRALTEARERLIKATEELRALTALNQDLVRQSLAFVEHTLDVLTDSPEAHLTYPKPNQATQQATRRVFFDQKA